MRRRVEEHRLRRIFLDEMDLKLLKCVGQPMTMAKMAHAILKDINPARASLSA